MDLQSIAFVCFAILPCVRSFPLLRLLDPHTDARPHAPLRGVILLPPVAIRLFVR